MFYNDPERTFRILGVYRFTRFGKSTYTEAGRSFSALAFRIKGKSKFTFGKQTCTAEEKSILYIPAGVAYTRASEDEEIIILHLRVMGKDDTELSSTVIKEAEEVFEELLLAWGDGGRHNYNRCMALLYRIFETVERCTSLPASNTPPAIADGAHYLAAHALDPHLTVGSAAKRCHVSEVWFRQAYREAFGISPWQDVLNRRFAHAKTLLQTGYYSIKEVALRSGFSDVKYFRTAFSKRYGCTPSEFAAR